MHARQALQEPLQQPVAEVKNVVVLVLIVNELC